jgi:tetratricopeptide (TPR) repeat protein
VNESQIFGNALKCATAAERAAYLDEACAGDPGLRADLEALLRAHASDPGFLERPSVPPGATTGELPAHTGAREQPGLVLGGRYKLLELLGEGGMGSVWMAQQTEPVKRLVAVKLIRPGMDSKAVLARFEAERQALALMDHPNIARVLDAGATPDGRPFFVLELVKGRAITAFCDGQRLTLRQRLELFVPVCQAIQHAHTKGVIHRDIKPTNVLVALFDDRPVPKVIDFGVAKATGQQLTEKTLHTGFGAVVGTLEYMSPEQASFNQLDVDTRSDVYSLGALLYELLTGSPPLTRKEMANAGILEFLRAIREQEPTRPSTRLSTADGAPALAASRRTEPRQLAAQMQGELDWIVMKALARDRTRRYETATGLAADLQRYLADEPVQACPPSAWYHLRKFVRRNRVAVTCIGLVLLVLLTSTGGIAWNLREQAARQAETGRDVDQALDQGIVLRGQGKWLEARAAGERAERLSAQGNNVAQHQRAVRFLADLNMAERLEELGLESIGAQYDLPAAIRASLAYTKAFEEYGIDLSGTDRAAAAARIRDSAIAEELLRGLDDWFWLRAFYTPRHFLAGGFFLTEADKQKVYAMRTGDVPGDALRAVIEMADRDELRKRIRACIKWANRPTPQSLEELVGAEEVAGLPPATALMLARVFELGSSTDRALRTLYAAQQRHPTDLWLNHALALHLGNSGTPILCERGAGFARAALALRPHSAGLHFTLGATLQTTELDQGITAFQTAIALKPDFRSAYHRLGGALASKRDWEGSVAAYSKAIELEQVHGYRPYHERGQVYVEIGQWDRASADYGELWDYPGRLFRREEYWCEPAAAFVLAGRLQDYRTVCRGVLDAYLKVARAAAENKKAADRAAYLAARTCVLGPDAVADPAEVVRLAGQAVTADPMAAWYLHTLGMAHYRAGDFPQAIRRFRECLEADRNWSAQVVNWLGLALAHARLGQTQDAQEWLDRAVRWIDETTAKSPKKGLAAIPGLHRHDWLACHALRREAETLIGRARK